MQLNTSKEALRRILNLCYKNGFFRLQAAKNSAKSIQYGPLGSLLTRNIWREWLSSVINNGDVTMFPIEVVNTGSCSKRVLNKGTSSVLPAVFENYFRTVPVVGADTVCGFAAYGHSLDLNQNDVHSKVLENSSVLRYLETRHSLCVVFFCPFKKSSEWFNYWSRYRYRWWRKFSSIPSKFSMSEVTETELGDQQISLLMEFPWGNESLETIVMHKKDFFQNSSQAMDLNLGEDLDRAVIVCESELNLAAFAYISNSFAEKWREGEIRKLLQLHSKLAPYKVCIFVRSDVPEDLRILEDVARHLVKELKKHHVAVYPYWEGLKEDSHFSRYDEMGVPYTIVLDEKASHSGIALLRSRDTTLEEQVHLAELTPKLLKYLQMKSFGVNEF